MGNQRSANGMGTARSVRNSCGLRKRLLMTGNKLTRSAPAGTRCYLYSTGSMPIESSAIFTRDGGAFVPSDLAQGPWDPDAQHGGPVAALLARAVEQHEHETGLMVVRMTVELLRPVPLAPLTVTTETQRPGKRVQWIEARLQIASTGVEVARARALRGRLNPFELPSSAADSDSRPAPPETGDVMNDTLWPGFARAMERRPVAGRAFPELGPATVWLRLRNPLVAGEEPSG